MVSCVACDCLWLWVEGDGNQLMDLQCHCSVCLLTLRFISLNSNNRSSASSAHTSARLRILFSIESDCLRVERGSETPDYLGESGITGHGQSSQVSREQWPWQITPPRSLARARESAKLKLGKLRAHAHS